MAKHRLTRRTPARYRFADHLPREPSRRRRPTVPLFPLGQLMALFALVFTATFVAAGEIVAEDPPAVTPAAVVSTDTGSVRQCWSEPGLDTEQLVQRPTGRVRNTSETENENKETN